jgi:hypothetical protein
MDEEPQDTTSSCLVCGGNRWWCSRTGARVCQRCYQDPLQALQALADKAQGTCRLGTDSSDERLPQDTTHKSAEGS